MFGKMMNSYYYGKSGKGDYNKDDLPQNRWQLFWEMLRIRLSGIVRLNLLYVLIWIPTIAVILINFFNWLGLFSAFVEETITAQQFSDGSYSVFFYALLMLIPCIAITGPFTAGVSYVTRNWARDEHSFIWSDFKDAVKENWKQALGISVITSVIPFVLFICWRFYGQMAATNVLFIVPQILTVIIALVWCLGLVFFYPVLISYKLNFGGVLRNGILLAIARLPQTVGIRLATLLPLAIGIAVMFLFGQVQWVILALIVYYALFGYCFTRFVNASFTNAVFDKYINVHIEGVEVDRGLREESDEDDEDEDDEDTIE